MLRLIVRATSVHFGIPIPVKTGGLKSSFKYPPPSTVRGMLESLLGLQRGEFVGDIAIGILRPPGGRGTPLYSNTGEANGKHPRNVLMYAKENKDAPSKPVTLMQPYRHEIFYDVEYQFAVRGPMIEQIRCALRGDVERFGVLSLGTSDNEVYDIVEESVDAQWIVPGTAFPLIVESRVGPKNRQPVMGRFELSPKMEDIPPTAWISYSASN